ncbi:MAG: hypothetical protein AAF799_30165 [Myxococcota bacterium]
MNPPPIVIAARSGHDASVRRHTTRGATLISVLLVVLALAAIAVLSVRSASREIRGASAQVQRERARDSAAAAWALASARVQALSPTQLDAVLAGSRPQASDCPDTCRDCLPQGMEWTTSKLGTTGICTGRLCARPGAVAQLPDASGTATHWCDMPLRQLLPDSEADTRVSVWIRNDIPDALDGGGWRRDDNREVVLTAIAQVGGVQAIEQGRTSLGSP